ncbi:MAG TPA: hypothetical protein VD905_02365 [Flavobacteriales bacterium]|nr:hypothetical protein [Flavobacteriales bacterium]
MKFFFKTFVVTCLSMGFAPLKAQTAEELIAKHIEAIGGKENWEKVKTVRFEGKMKAQGAEIKIVRTQVDRKAVRTDISVMGMNGYTILTNKEGWNYMPFGGMTKPEPMTADDVKSSQDELNVQGDFLTYKEMGKKMEYLGTEDYDGTECHKIKMTDKDGQETTFFMDPETFYIIKQTNKIVADGKESTMVMTFSNYKKLDAGIVYPMTVGGDWGDTEIISVEINANIDESIFKI